MSSVSSVKQIQHLRGSASSAECAAGFEDACCSCVWSADGVAGEAGRFRRTVCESSEVVDGLLVECSSESWDADVDVG